MTNRRPRPGAASALAAAFCAWIAPAAAQQRPLAQADLPAVMTAYADTVVEMRDIYAACASTQPGGWDEGAALLVESLRAAGLDAATAAAIASRLAAAPSGAAVDCAAPQMQLRAGLPSGQDWPAFHKGTLERAGVPVVVPVEKDERLAAARAVVEKEMPLQARMLECLSLFDPQNFVLAYSDWDGMLERTAGHFTAAGYPASVHQSILGPAASASLYRRPADRAAASASCAADQAWYERFSIMAWYTIAADVEDLMKGAKP